MNGCARESGEKKGDREKGKKQLKGRKKKKRAHVCGMMLHIGGVLEGSVPKSTNSALQYF